MTVRTYLATLTGNPADDTYAIGAGSGSEIPPSGGGGTLTLALPVTALGNISGTTALTLPSSAGGAFTGSIVGATTFSAPTGASSSVETVIDMKLSTDGTGGYAITWFPGIAWTNGAPAPIVAGQTSAVTLWTMDGGTTWQGSYGPLTMTDEWYKTFNLLATPSLNVGSAWTPTVAATSYPNFVLDSGNAQNAQVGWDCYLSAGTWTVSTQIATNTNGGIYTVAIDGTTVGTFDGYSGSLAYNVVKDLTGVVIGTSGKHRLTFTMATKNGSSSGYAGHFSAIAMIRTA